MFIFVRFADISGKIFFQSLESFFFEFEIRFIELRQDIWIYTSLVFSHIDQFLVCLFIIELFLESFRIGVGDFVDIDDGPLPKHLES